MVSTFTPNIQLEEPARGDDVGTWDTPVNNNMTLIDLVAGNITTISLNNSNILLSAGQFRSKQITFNSTLTGSVTITFPTSFTKSYEIQNLCTGTSAFTITLQTTATGGQVVCCPPGEIIDCVNDGANLKFKDLGRVGTYWDYAGSSVPSWVSGCTVPPYLNCDGTTFSSGTYPALATILGSTTLPDSRGRSRFTLNQGQSRITSGVSGLDGNTRGAAGGDQSLQSHTHGVVDPGHTHAVNQNANIQSGTIGVGAGAPFTVSPTAAATISLNASLTGITVQNSGAGGAQNVPPAYVGGLTMIRAG